jgi:hypothetical protein
VEGEKQKRSNYYWVVPIVSKYIPNVITVWVEYFKGSFHLGLPINTSLPGTKTKFPTQYSKFADRGY